MKATINGIQVDGTPEEIIKFRELLAKSDAEFKGGYVTSVKPVIVGDKDFKYIMDKMWDEVSKGIKKEVQPHPPKTTYF